jgi:hypothetical protein
MVGLDGSWSKSEILHHRLGVKAAEIHGPSVRQSVCLVPPSFCSRHDFFDDADPRLGLPK